MKSGRIVVVFLLTLCSLTSRGQSTLKWEHLPGPLSPLLAYAETLVADKTGVIYSGTRGKGVYRSVDKGNTWVEIRKPIENGFVNALAVDSNDNVFAATRLGLFMSSDHGENWTKILADKAFVWNEDIEHIVISPFNQIYINYRTRTSYRATIGEFVWDSITCPRDFVFRVEPSGKILSSNNKYFPEYYSIDNGKTWTTIDYLTVAPNVNTMWSPQYSGTIAHVITDSGLYRSIDSGKTFNYQAFKGKYFGLYAHSAYGILFASTKDQISNKDTVFVSHNFGLNWTPITTRPTDSLLRQVFFVDSQRILAIWGSATYASDDSGRTWKYSMLGTGYVSKCFTTLDGRLAALAGQAIHLSSDLGASWVSIPTPYQPHDAIVNHDTLYFSVYYQGQVYKSTDKGISWTMLPLEAYSAQLAILNDRTLFVAADTSLYTSVDAGVSWKQIEIDPDTSSSAAVTTVVIAPDKTLWVGTSGGLFYSADTGKSIGIVSTVPMFVNVASLHFDEESGVFVNTWQDISHSHMKGVIWTTIPPPVGVPFSFRSLEYCRGNLIATAEEFGVLRTSNRGRTWIDESAGVWNTFVVGCYAHGGYIFLSTTGGLYRSIDTSLYADTSSYIGVKDSNDEDNLRFTVWPNPTTMFCDFTVEVPHFGPLDIVIFDQLGRQSKKIEFFANAPGPHQLKLFVGDLPAGQYLISAYFEGIVATTKVIKQ